MVSISRRNKQIIYAVLSGILVTTLIFVIVLITIHAKSAARQSALERNYQAELDKFKEAQNLTIQSVYTVNRAVAAGDKVPEEAVATVEVPKAILPANAATELDQVIGKTAKVRLEPQTLLTSTLLYNDEPATADLRNREMSFVQLPMALKNHDTVDVRIQFPTGQDYILLSKKKINSLAKDTISVTLKEHEILSLSSAIVDAYLHKASIYALTYVEPELQEEAVSTYPVNERVLQLIQRDPNIVVKAENALSKAARVLLEQNLTMVTPQEAASYESSQTMNKSNAGSEPADLEGEK
ncbi:hypothetical protein DCC85_11950 [Paenibacillus sp. CAA11]|uniref:SAF domain-containing protein n=1 Tax=Paenibacillus sp. CAA11 TaxID=1532905 RepID=UPI000D34D412|nr:SAF domain-containing protein [Paenibacillus sp. CAA11]AWB44861.1 hypothetical protein DCC85_11950 [Paenibacillus sp. CAA11]